MFSAKRIFVFNHATAGAGYCVVSKRSRVYHHDPFPDDPLDDPSERAISTLNRRASMSSNSLTTARRIRPRLLPLCPAALLIFILTLPEAHAQRTNILPFEVDRPYVAVPPTIVPPGYLQIESGIVLDQDASGAGPARVRHRAITYPAITGRLGILPGIELQVGAEYLDETDTDIRGTEVARRLGLRHVTAGAKMRIMEEDGTIPASAFLLKLELPMGHEGLYPPFAQPSFLLSLRNTLGEDLRLTYSLGGSWNGSTGAARGIYATALSARFIPKGTAFVELQGGFASGEAPAHSLGAGIAYQVGSSVQLDLAGSKGLTLAAADTHLSLGVSFRLPRFPVWIVD